MDNLKMPRIKFEPLIDNSEDSLLKRIWSNTSASCFLVYLRCKYFYETKWEYLIECCCPYNSDDIMWFNDWYEGQQNIEYLGVAVIDIP